MNPELMWNEQFKVMREKLVASITKLMKTKLNSYQTQVCFNMYMTRSVFFDCGIMELTES